MAAPTPSKLDFAQVLQGSYDELNGRLRVDAEITASIIAPPGLEVAISAIDDSIAIRNSTNTNELLINSDGSINVTSTVTGSPNININQVGGTSTAVNNGIANSGTLRVAIASDNTAFSVNAIQSTSPWIISGTVTANAGTNLNTSALALETTQLTGNITLASILLTQTDKTQFTKITDGTDTVLVTATGELNVLSTAQPGVDIGDVTVNNGAGIAAVNIQDGGNSLTVDGSLGRTWTLSSGTDSVNIGNFPATVAVTQSTSPWVVSGTITANAGTNLNTSLLQLDTTGAKLNNAQGSTTSSQTGPLIQGAVTTAAPSYTTAQTSPLSLTTVGNLRVDGSSVTQPVSGTITANQGGTWNINNISGTISLPTGASTSALQTTGNTSLSSIDDKLVDGYGLATTALRTASQIGNTTGAALFGAGTTTAQVLRVVLPTDQTAIPITDNSGSLTVDQPTASNLNAQVVGNVASGAADSGNPVRVAGKYNATIPVYTDGSRAGLQVDINGRLLTSDSHIDGYKATYGTTIVGLSVAATPTDIFTITGSSTKTIRITKILFSGFQNTSSPRDVLLIKRSTANSGGTSTSPTRVPYDSTSAAATGTVLAYTANPTLGTTVGTIYTKKILFMANSASSNFDNIYQDFGNGPSQAIVLRGTSEVLAINLNSVTSTGNSINVFIEWTEE